ncbi:hypothetical protein [Dickeya phage Amaethon]|nr:hypothetical protein [Dickeya phage Amaethon]
MAMTRVEKILKAVRYSLADPTAERYSDERLLSAISDGQKDIARQTRLLKAEIDIALSVSKVMYDLPANLWLIERVHYKNEKLPLLSYDRMDSCNLGWFKDYGKDVKSIVYDKRDMHKLRIYPRPDDSFIALAYVFQAEASLTADSSSLTAEQVDYMLAQVATLTTLVSPTPFDLAPVYTAAYNITSTIPALEGVANYLGIVTSVEGTVLDSIFGVFVDTEVGEDFAEWQTPVVFDGVFGVLVGLQNTSGTLNIMYIKDAADIVSKDSVLEVSPIFDIALKYFALGQAFSDDLDTENQQRSATAYQMYNREIAVVGTPTDMTDGTRSSQYTGAYIGPFSQ